MYINAIAGGKMDSLSVANHTFITDIAENGEGLARYQAQELLCFFYNECVEYPINMNGGQNKSFIQGDDTQEVENSLNFEIYPNPSDAFVTIILPIMDAPLLITIVDINGKLIYSKKCITEKTKQETWNSQNTANGTYLISLKNLQTNEIIATKKVTIAH